MQFKTIHGSIKKVTKANKYKIDWDKPSRSKIQFNAKQKLKSVWSNHIVFEEFPVVGTKMSLDFYNANKKIAIEVQGRQHNKFVPYFHGNNKINFISQMRRDHQKREFCRINKIILIEVFKEKEIEDLIEEGVLY